MGTGLLVQGTKALAQSSSSLTAGDAAILQFLAAGEALEADFWTQYNELCGIQDGVVSGGTGNRIYTEKVRKLDPKFPQYVHDNTRDEISHLDFINAYLTSKGAQSVNMEPFQTLPGSTATGSSGKLRLTNLTQLTLDTSWWTRYRSGTNNPDVNPTTFEQAVPDLHKGQFTAIPRTDADLYPEEHIQAIANTAAFHMPTVEQGGGTLRIALALRVTSVEVQQIVTSMGPIESMHFQTWHEKAGKAPAIVDPTNGLSFPDLNDGIDPNTGASGTAVLEMFQTDLIMPVPLSIHQLQPAGMFRDPPDEHDWGGHGGPEVSHRHGAVHRPVGCVLLVYGRSGPGRGRGSARHVTTSLQAYAGAAMSRPSVAGF